MARVRSNQRTTKKTRAASDRLQRRTRRRQPAANDVALVALAHDIRTSLTGILALGELLASSNLGERERQWAEAIKTGAEHLAALTSLVVDAAKVESGSLALQQQPFRQRRLIDALADSLAVRAQTKGLEAEVEFADDVPEVLIGDPVRLRAALENLIDNAVKFTAQGRVRLDVRFERQARGRVKLIVSVTDSGIGLSAAEIKRLFRPFAQASADVARRYGGAGLGLAVVKHLARLMEGDLTVASVPGRGSTFCFTASLQVAPAETVDGAGRRPARAPLRSLAILCVEDNPYGRVILNTILTELGHRADFAGSAEEAIAAFPRGYDVMLVDVTLPHMDGLEATRLIRALPDGAGTATPIIGISGRSEAGDEVAARAAGMNYYLRKPISPSALSEALGAVLAPESG